MKGGGDKRGWARWRGEGGQSIVLVGLLLSAMIGFSALVVDVGFGYVGRRQQQNAADAAALGAANHLLSGTTSGARVFTEIDRYVRLNGGDPAQFQATYVDANGEPISPVQNSGTVPGNAAGVTVVSRATVPGVFAKIWGTLSFGVAARADAMIEGAQTPPEWTGLAPIAVPEHEFEKADKNTTLLWGPSYAKHYNDIYPGYDLPDDWKGLLDFDSYSSHMICNEGNKPGAAKCWTDKGLDGAVPLEADVPLFNGDLGNNVADALRSNISRQNLSDDKGQYGLIYIVVYDDYQDDDEEINVSNFACVKVYLDDVEGSSAPGTFVEYGLPKGRPGSGAAGGPRIARLVPPRTPVTSLPAPTSTPAPGSTPAPTPTTAPSCNVVVSGPTFSPTAQGSKKFDLSATWATDSPANYVLEWGPADDSLSVVANGGPSTSVIKNLNNQNNGTYNWRLSIVKPGCSTPVQSSGTYSFP